MSSSAALRLSAWRKNPPRTKVTLALETEDVMRGDRLAVRTRNAGAIYRIPFGCLLHAPL